MNLTVQRCLDFHCPTLRPHPAPLPQTFAQLSTQTLSKIFSFCPHLCQSQQFLSPTSWTEPTGRCGTYKTVPVLKTKMVFIDEESRCLPTNKKVPEICAVFRSNPKLALMFRCLLTLRSLELSLSFCYTFQM